MTLSDNIEIPQHPEKRLLVKLKLSFRFSCKGSGQLLYLASALSTGQLMMYLNGAREVTDDRIVVNVILLVVLAALCAWSWRWSRRKR